MQDLEHQRAMAQKRIRAAARVASSAAGPDAEQCAADRATLEDDLAGIERRIAGLRQRMRDRRAFRRGAGAPVAARPQEPDEAAAPQKARFQPPWEAPAGLLAPPAAPGFPSSLSPASSSSSSSASSPFDGPQDVH
ncbi:unnamed protein product [Prorocentrum cordatum]|nr:unnamed protein product [Polarella glacialis]